ncbi:erg10, partial [Symbiodinium sp. KB8]
DVVIASAVRTPIGSFQGSLASVPATRLAATAVKEAVARAGVKGEDINEVYLGNVCSANLGQAPTRQATLFAGLPRDIPCTTVNKVCASGMKSVMFAAQSIMTGYNDVVVAGGFESMSNVPYYLPGGRSGMRYGNGEVVDGLIKDGLWDVYNDFHMVRAGMCAEKCAADYGISREEQDNFAIQSYERSAAASKAGKFKKEIVGVEVPQRRGDPLIVSEDEEFKRIQFDKIPGLRPAVKKDGTVTAANASTLNDGASALVVMSGKKAKALGITPLARILGFGDAAQNPEDFTTAPAKAVPLAYKRAGVSPTDVEYHEINEAFSVVVLANMKLLNLDPSRVNVNGGGVSLGHPIGNSGSRIIATLINVLEQNDATLGSASICNGGGGASAIVVERL